MKKYWVVVAGFVALLLMLVSPWAIPNRVFGGAGVLLNPFGEVNLRAVNVPEISTGWLAPAFWLWVVILVAFVVSQFITEGNLRRRMLYGLGFLGIALFSLEAFLFYQSIHEVNNAAVAAGATRPPLRRFTLSLGAYTGLFLSFAMLILGRLETISGRAFFVRYRGAVVPLVSLIIAVLIGAGIVWILKPGMGTAGLEGLSYREYLMSKFDVVTYVFQLLFAPIIGLSGSMQSLVLATPLIFTGLAVGFGFRAGLFNIGAPGQLMMGAIAAMLVGVYLPGPRWIVLPLAIFAAALGGGIWGAIPGWLKARFGAHEVINTIMLNFVANSIFLLLLSANDYKFFGRDVHIPFKTEGYEGQSQLIQPTGQIPLLMGGILLPNGHFSWALPLAVILSIAAYWFGRRLELGKRVLAAVGALALGWVVGGFLPGFAVSSGSELSSVRLNGSFLIALAALVFYQLYLFRTSAGYEIRVAGLAPKAAEYAGINLQRKIVLAMVISGALAGLAATHYVLGGGIDEYRLKQNLPADGAGFDGIAVALMGQNTPVGIFLSSLLFGVLRTGSLAVNLEVGISRDLVIVLQALVVFFVAVGGLLPRYFTDPVSAAQVEIEAKAAQEAATKGEAQ